jgi:hypothetical protein
MMEKPTNWSKSFIIFFALLVSILRWFYPERPLDYIGLRAILDSIFALSLLFLTMVLATGLGLKLMHRLEINGLAYHELVLFALPLGIGILAYGILLLGLLGNLQPLVIFIWLIVASVFTHNEWGTFVATIPAILRKVIRGWFSEGFEKRVLLIALSLILMMTLGQALSPPTDPDGLIYHLLAPKLFLEAGHYYAISDFVFANYPSTMESIFVVGLAFGSDTYAKLLHLLTATSLVIAMYVLGRRFLRKGANWRGVLILVGMPIVPIWAGLAYIDMGWALFEFLALYAMLIWESQRQRNFLVLSGVMMGLAMGAKYSALGGSVAFALWLLWILRREGWKTLFSFCALFLGVAILVGSPWYIKNWILLGDPLYPYLSSVWANLLDSYESFGLANYLILPWLLFVDRERFVGAYGSIEFPSIFFPLVLLYPFVRRSKSSDSLAGFTLLRYVFWALTSPWRFRYLIPAMPGLSLLAASVITHLTAHRLLRKWGNILFRGLLAGMLIATLVYSLLFFIDVQPWRVDLGIESKEDFLRREVSDYPAKEFIQTNLPIEALVLMPWDARGYYCDARCVPDWLRKMWVDLVTPGGSPAEIGAKLHALDFTHLLLSIEDVDYSIINDTSGRHYEALVYLINDFIPACTEEIFEDKWTTLYELTCK